MPWQLMTSSAIEQPEARQRARLLAGITVLTFIVLAGYTVVNFDLWLAGGLVGLVLAYAISRTRYVQMATAVFLVSLLGVSLAFPLVLPILVFVIIVAYLTAPLWMLLATCAAGLLLGMVSGLDASALWALLVLAVAALVAAYQKLIENRYALAVTARFQALADAMDDAVMVHDVDRLLYVNPAAVRLVGVEDAAAIVGSSVLAHLPEEHRDVARRVFRTGISAPAHQCEVIRADGATRSMQLTAAAIEYDGQQAVQVSLSEPERVIQKLDETILQAMAEGVLVVDREGDVIFANASAADLLASSGSDWSAFWDLFYEEGHLIPREQHPVMRAMRTKRKQAGVVLGACPEDPRWLMMNVQPVVESGTVVASFVDVTGRRRVDANLEIYARQQAALAELSREALIVENTDAMLGKVVSLVASVLGADLCEVMMNQRGRLLAQAAVGWPADVIDTLTVAVQPESRVANLLAADEPLVVADLFADAHFDPFPTPAEQGVTSSISALIYGKPAPFGILSAHRKGGPAFGESEKNFIQSVSNGLSTYMERQRVNMELRRLNASLELRVAQRTAQLQTILDFTGEGIIYTEDGRIDYVNHAICQMTGYSELHLINNAISMLLNGIEKSRIPERLRQVDEVVMRSGVWRGEMHMLRRDGSHFTAGLTIAMIGQPDERPLRSVTVVRDISEEKIVEAQRARFLSNASHELRTPITNLSTRLYLMRRRPERLEEHMAVLTQVENRLRSLVENLLDVSFFQHGIIELDRQSVSLAEVVLDVVNVQRQEADRRRIEVSTLLPSESLMVNIDRERMIQVLTNLLNNAIHFTPSGGMVHIQAEVQMDDDGIEYGVVHVQDSGVGIPSDHIDSIFQPFYRVDEIVKGTGLGLSISQEIVQAHNGDIRVKSLLGQGSSFEVWLPL